MSTSADWPAPPSRGRSGYTPWAVTSRSLGWLIAGASQGAAPRFLAALRALPPLPNDAGVSGWATAIYSRNEGRARAFAAQHQIPFHGANLDELCARPDIHAVYVSNRPQEHAATVRAALRAGKHVLCEAPLALSLDEARFLQAFAADHGLVLAINFQQRFDPAFVALRALVAEDDLGDLIAIHMHQVTSLAPAQETWRTADEGGGLLFERTLHTLDAARMLCGDEIVRVAAWRGPSNHGATVVDDLHALLQVRGSGAVIHLHDSWNAGRATPRIELYATRGNATIANWNPLRTSRLFVERAGLRPNGPLSAAHAAPEPLPLPEADLWQMSLLTVHEAIRVGAPPAVSAQDGIVALALASALRKSLESGESAGPSLAP
jgi:1,5-anhydro-D-fructose reductase (1,5-anhydro-D-mannitol-forming)